MDKQASGLMIIQRAAEVVMVLAVVLLVYTYVKEKGKNFSKVGAAGLAFFGALSMRYMSTEAGKVFVSSSWFNQPTTNQVVYWAIMCALVAVIIISLVHFFDRSTNPAFDFKSYGISVTCKQVMLALGLALTLLAVGYALLYTIDYLLIVDFRFLVMGSQDIRSISCHVGSAVCSVLLDLLLLCIHRHQSQYQQYLHQWLERLCRCDLHGRRWLSHLDGITIRQFVYQ